MRKRRWIGLSALFTATLLSTAMILPAPYTQVTFISSKLEHLRTRDRPYDILLIGSSHVHRQLDPTRIDRRLERAGHPLSSFNLGAAGMRLVESVGMLETIARDARTRPRWVVLEATLFSQAFKEENTNKVRTVYWHTPRVTAWALDSVFGIRFPNESREKASRREWRYARRHLVAAAQHFFNLGTFSGSIQARLRPIGREADLEKTRGYFPRVGVSPALQKAKRKRYWELRKEFLATYDPASWTLDESYAEDSPQRRLLRHAARICQRHEIRLAFLITPIRTNNSSTTNTIREAGLGPILDYSRIEAFPELYQLRNRYSWNHLNVRGSNRFSDLFAEAFVEILDQ